MSSARISLRSYKCRSCRIGLLLLAATATASLAGCGGNTPPAPPAGALLRFPQAVIDEQDHQLNGMVPEPSVCGGGGFITDLNTKYEWMPLLPGTGYRNAPTVDEGQVVAGGQVDDWHLSSNDVLAAHPWGYDTEWDILLNPTDFLRLNYVPSNVGNNLLLHVEIEQGLFPYADFGWTPRNADYVLVKGDWIFDCGHPDRYHAEIHPPSFVALARSSGETTTSLAIAIPYRTLQLYNPNEKLAYDLKEGYRFTDSNTKPFPDHLNDEVNNVVFHASQHLEAHAMVGSTNLDYVDWLVCAPTPAPPDSQLTYTYHFTVRPGVGIAAIPNTTPGCVEFIAVIGGGYSPAPIYPRVASWTWQDINKAVNLESLKPIDVKQKIYDGIPFCALAVHCYYEGIENNPLIDQYPPLYPPGDAIIDSPIGIMTNGADNQPFPFYGRVKVSWTPTSIPPPACIFGNICQ